MTTQTVYILVALSLGAFATGGASAQSSNPNRNAESAVGVPGQRQGAASGATARLEPTRRISNRLQNRVDNRIENRIDKDYRRSDSDVTAIEEAIQRTRRGQLPR